MRYHASGSQIVSLNKFSTPSENTGPQSLQFYIPAHKGRGLIRRAKKPKPIKGNLAAAMRAYREKVKKHP
jgi:hypothetical protein